MKSYKRIGDYIRLVSNRNSDWAITNLFGVNIYKNFMPSVANTSGVDLSKYKIIRKGQFATNIMHVNRDEILPVALYQNDELCKLPQKIVRVKSRNIYNFNNYKK
jgi:type I restriction enzyme S subunit